MDIPGPISWSARSLFLSACDFFKWGCLKRREFGTLSAELRDLELSVSEERKAMTHVRFCLYYVANERMRLLHKAEKNLPSISVSSTEPNTSFQNKVTVKSPIKNSKVYTKYLTIKRSI